MEQRLGPYLILETIGRGAAGRVFRARGPEGREVALKLLIGTQSADSLGRFERERKLLSELGHELGFVPLLDAGTSPQGPYVVMELMHGGTLGERLQRSGRLDLPSAIELGGELARALAAAHARGVVHRDLKPGNILYTREGELRVADLGLAKFHEDTSDSLSKTGVLRGTVGYMPPEQMLDAKRAGPRADVFAWGVVVYEALTGESPFGNGPPMEIVYNLERSKFRPLRELRPDAPPALGSLLGRCLASDPNERPADGAALQRELQALSRGLEGERSGLGLSVLGAVAALLLGAGVALGLLLGGRGHEAGTPSASPGERVRSAPSSAPLEPSRSPDQSPAPGPSQSPEPSRTPGSSPALPSPAGSPGTSVDLRRTARTKIPIHLGSLKEGKRLALRALLGDFRGKHLGLVTDVAWGPKPGFLTTVELSGWIRVWSARGEVYLSMRSPQRLHTVDTGGDGWGVIGGDQGAVLVRLDGREGVLPLPARGKCVSARFVSPDRVVVSGGTGLALHEVPSGRELWRVAEAHAGEGTFVNGLRYVAARDEIVSGARSVKVWSASSGELLRTFALPEGFEVEDLEVTPSGDRIFVSGQTPKLLEFEREGGGQFAFRDLEQPGYTRALAMLPSGALFTGHDDGSIVFRGGGGEARVGQHLAWVHGLRVGPSLALASVGNDAQLRVWHPRRQEGPQALRPGWEASGHSGPVVQLTVQGDRVYSRSRDGLRIWSRSDASEVKVLPPATKLLGRAARVLLAISPSGQRVLRLGQGFAIDDVDRGRILAWANDDPKRQLWHASFVDEDTIAALSLEGEQFRIKIPTQQILRAPKGEGLFALRSIPGLGWVRVYRDRLEVETDQQVVQSRFSGRPQWFWIDTRGTILLGYQGFIGGAAFDPETRRFRTVQAPVQGQLLAFPAFAPGLRYLAIADERGLVLYDTSVEPSVLVDRLDFSSRGDVLRSLDWTDNGELMAGSSFGPIFCYEVREP